MKNEINAVRPDGGHSHDRGSALVGLLERQLFAHRAAVLLLFLILSTWLTWHAAMLKPDASFQKMVPASHPYIANYFRYENELRPLGNVVRIAVEAEQGDIY
ncbi:hypothetical protein ACO0K4_19600, partial [Undibacterium sp. RuTC16W]